MCQPVIAQGVSGGKAGSGAEAETGRVEKCALPPLAQKHSLAKDEAPGKRVSEGVIFPYSVIRAGLLL